MKKKIWETPQVIQITNEPASGDPILGQVEKVRFLAGTEVSTANQKVKAKTFGEGAVCKTIYTINSSATAVPFFFGDSCS